MYTLVTACMNRESHLRANLPRWLELPGLAEIIVVDWSNQRSLEDLRSIDSRVAVVRVEGESKWILSYAYNVGIARAAHPVVVKCDADCLPRREVLALVPGAEGFFAGHWKSGAAVNKPSVNGQCVLTKAQFETVNGYSEVIRTYGRDDEDFYDRLITAGFARREISPAHLDFIAHSHGERTVNQFAPGSNPTVEARILRDPLYNEMHNAFIAQRLPWGPASNRARYREIGSDDRLTVLRRDQAAEIPIPPEIENQARLFALRYMATQVASLPRGFADRLDDKACVTLVASRMNPPAKPAHPPRPTTAMTAGR